MFKTISAALLLLTLIGIFIYNISVQNNPQQSASNNEIDVSGDSSVDGTVMVSPQAPQGLKIGDKAPDFTLETLDGEKVSLSDYQGKKVFLNFWATWCGPCRVEMPDMEEFYNEYGDEVEIIAVNATGTETNITAVRNFIEEGNFSFLTLIDPDLAVVVDQYSVLTIPTTYFIGTDGIIQAEKMMGPMTFKYMEEMMNKIN
ncbi:redoxin domain-containing protein [Aquibacillus halophilus]|uniref:Redoxin domain-containing protein n=1 Tax=Aquibacillus halophilus TaxID=930132 RepID=A0A6A8DDK9_9BACI|nr:redoxin domain-containing protein [Aquibacillus halophilus]MRH42606.1 redoxin domain-containing protein [Aquibacillus halophilus]